MDTRDHLTGLYTKKELDQQLRAQLTECLVTHLPFALLMLDIDHFKKFNDSHGHEFGNKVLKSVADIVMSVTKGKGAAFRYGGEEFTVLLPNHTTQEAIAVGERIRKSIESSSVEGKSVTISIGVSVAPPQPENPEELIDMADKALYSAKNHGRNLVRVFGESEPPKQREREPERKQAEAGKLTEEQRTEIRERYFQGYRVTCPDDNAILKVIVPPKTVGQKTQGIHISCPLCGLSEYLK